MEYADKLAANREYWANLSPEQKRRATQIRTERKREQVAQFSAEELAAYQAKNRAYYLRRKQTGIYQTEEYKAAHRADFKRWYHTNENGKRYKQERIKDPNQWEREWRFYDYYKSLAYKKIDLFSGVGLNFRSLRTLDNPWVVVELKGHRHRERLLDTQPISPDQFRSL